MRLLKLLPSEQTKQSIREVKLGNSEFAVKIDDMAKYTMDVSIKQLSGMVKGITPLYLTVRLYNDAKVAEIIHHDYHQRIKPSYGYPNPKMHQKDEKYQLNAFLYDWLVACVEHGQATLNWDVNNGLV
ncbi:putative dehydrogenase [Pseudoalteromonas nigrifaciens]|nr:putative dehydrogenase [Pseudoalteromonas nigrifaciens]